MALGPSPKPVDWSSGSGQTLEFRGTRLDMSPQFVKEMSKTRKKRMLTENYPHAEVLYLKTLPRNFWGRTDHLPFVSKKTEDQFLSPQPVLSWVFLQA